MSVIRFVIGLCSVVAMTVGLVAPAHAIRDPFIVCIREPCGPIIVCVTEPCPQLPPRLPDLPPR